MRYLPAILATLLLSSLALASTVPALHARPVDPADDVACYEWAPGDGRVAGLKRLCAGVGVVDVGVPLNTLPGTKNITFSASRPTSGTVMSCRAIASSGSGTVTVGDEESMTTFGTAFQSVALDPIAVSTTGTVYVRCQVGQGAKLLSVSVPGD